MTEEEMFEGWWETLISEEGLIHFPPKICAMKGWMAAMQVKEKIVPTCKTCITVHVSDRATSNCVECSKGGIMYQNYNPQKAKSDDNTTT